MTDAEQKESNPEAQLLAKTLDEYQAYSHSPDWFIQQLVDLINRYGVSINITVQIGSAFMHGRLISASNYFEESSSKVKESFNQSDKDAEILNEVCSLFDNNAESMTIDEISGTDNEQAHHDAPSFIHMQISRMNLGGRSIDYDKPMLWRGRIVRIDGFSLGNWT